MLEVSEHGYFNWRTRGIGKRKLDEMHLSVRIEDAFHDTRGTMGALAFMQSSKNKGFMVEESALSGSCSNSI